MKITKLCCALVGAATLVTANTTFASLGTVTLTKAGGNANDGGLFKAVTSDNGTFNTFCLSIPTAFTLGHQYYYQISSTIDANNIPPAASFVTLGTAYLYNQFNQGNTFYTTRINAVQATIWYLQGDLVDNTSGSYTSADYGNEGGYIDPENKADLSSGITEVINQLETDIAGSDFSSLTADGKGAFKVSAMNLYSNSDLTKVAQPQLYQVVPEPSTIVAGVLLLLPFGLSTVRVMRKNKV